MPENIHVRLEPQLLELALQLYASATSTIAEFVALAWDSDARTVEVELQKDAVFLRHDGDGLDSARLSQQLLTIGRRSRETALTSGGRQRLTAGALGLLSYLGIARNVRLRSAGQIVAFDAVQIAAGNLVAEIQAADSRAFSGVALDLTDLRLRRQPSPTALRRALARRFAHLTDRMSIAVDGELVSAELPLAQRFPVEGFQGEKVDGMDVRWSVGFAHKPLPEEDRGVVIFSRGRLVQAPFTFLLAGGVKGQIGLTYMSGQLHVDLPFRTSRRLYLPPLLGVLSGLEGDGFEFADELA